MDLMLLIIILILPAIAQIYVMLVYNKNRDLENEKGLCGQEVAKTILEKNGLDNIYIVETRGNLTDHYDPSRKVIRLSSDIFQKTSIASLAISAHECGHAIQDKEGYSFYKIRSFIYPIIRIATTFSYIVILIGLLAQALNIIYVGIALTGCGLLFQIVTLPVELNASKRAISELEKHKLVAKNEIEDVRSVLNAAALTYVAGVLTSALQIIRLIMAFTDRN